MKFSYPEFVVYSQPLNEILIDPVFVGSASLAFVSFLAAMLFVLRIRRDVRNLKAKNEENEHKISELNSVISRIVTRVDSFENSSASLKPGVVDTTADEKYLLEPKKEIKASWVFGGDESSEKSDLEIAQKQQVKKSEHAQEIVKKSEPFEKTDLVRDGLKKTRGSFLGKLKTLFARKHQDETQIYQELEELLVTSDVGIKTSKTLLEGLREESLVEMTEQVLKQKLKNKIIDLLQDNKPAQIIVEKKNNLPFVILVVGVNGVGKTTTIGKLAAQFTSAGHKVLIGACDTFRAAAEAQLRTWAQRAQADIVEAQNEGAKPSTVAFLAINKGIKENYDVVILDTAGRLHTRVNLMNELSAVVKLIEREQPEAPHETILVLDASTGQNALQQAKEFNEKARLTGVVVTKLDGTPKGGVVIAIKNELGIPIRYIGVGEGIGDLQPFAADKFAEAIFSVDEDGSVEEKDGEKIISTVAINDQDSSSAHARVRRRRREFAAQEL